MNGLEYSKAKCGDKLKTLNCFSGSLILQFLPRLRIFAKSGHTESSPKVVMAKKTSNLKRFLSLQAENDLDRDEWMSVLLNSKDAALNQEFQNNGQTNNVNACFLELQRTIVSYIRTLPGNERCCDCDSTNGTLRSLARDSPWNTHHKGSITLRLVSSLT